MPVEEIGKLVHEKSKALSCRCHPGHSESIVSIQKAGIDLLSVSSHKIHETKGELFLYINKK